VSAEVACIGGPRTKPPKPRYLKVAAAQMGPNNEGTGREATSAARRA